MGVFAQRTVNVHGHAIATDSEGYLAHLDDWSEAGLRRTKGNH